VLVGLALGDLFIQRRPERKLELLKSIGFEQGVTVKNPIIPILPPMDPHFVSGLTEGDGSFFISRLPIGELLLPTLLFKSLLLK